MTHTLVIPSRPRGRLSAQKAKAYEADLANFCAAIIEIDRSLDFKVGTRGWCYLLEEYGLDKGDFGVAEKLITDCRKSGLLPLDICAEDSARTFENIEFLDDPDPEAQADSVVSYVEQAHHGYQPISFWDTQTYYVQMLVEKVDLKGLFGPVCAEYHVPIANARGSADINLRVDMMRRFAENEAKGRDCVLLYAGDHDPAGLRISDFLRSNLADLAHAVGWSPEKLSIERFGLNADFIRDHGLTWIENLETGSGRRLNDPNHPDHQKAYVQDYLTEFGARKVEANALVTRPEAGRELCRRAIVQFIDPNGIAAFKAATKASQAAMAEHLASALAGFGGRQP